VPQHHAAIDSWLARTTQVLLLGIAVASAGCGASSTKTAQPAASSSSVPAASAPRARDRPGGPANVYSADAAGDVSPRARRAPARVYVPNTLSDTVDVIDPVRLRVVGHFRVGGVPQHVTPSYDLRTLYVDSEGGNTLTPIAPGSARPRGRPIPVVDPYNLYFTPDGRSAIVVAERLRRLDFREPRTMALRRSLSVPACFGVDHMDFSGRGDVLYASCEFASRMIMVDLRREKVVKTLKLGGGANPQDVKLSPDGRILYVADQVRGGVWEIDAQRFRVAGFLHTGAGAHGLYPSRDARSLYVSNRAAGSVSVVRFDSRRVIKTWRLPGRASPDMGGVSADGGTLWLSGRYDSEVYAIDTHSGRLRARIPVGDGPHGLCVWPQPGRFSLGHTGVMR
jgi:DNA-binding beta-propeller fold protein YncE